MVSVLKTAESEFIPEGGLTVPEQIVEQFWPHDRAPYRRPEGLAAVEAVAEVNHGRWIVPCPFCPGGQFASAGDHRFFCIECLHQGSAAEGRWIPVRWPTDADRAQVEEALTARPNPRTRNWIPALEAPGTLEKENQLHELLDQLPVAARGTAATEDDEVEQALRAQVEDLRAEVPDQQPRIAKQEPPPDPPQMADPRKQREAKA